MVKASVFIGVCLFIANSSGPSRVDKFEQVNGIGIVEIHENPAAFFILYLYDTPDERSPHSRVIEMRYIENDRVVHGWDAQWEMLLPFRVFTGNGYPYLVCMEVRGSWFRVRLSDQQDYWIRQEERTYTQRGIKHTFEKLNLVRWDDFMANKAWVGRTDQAANPIRMRPTSKADTISYAYGDCLGPVEVKGRWLKVRPENGEGCISDTLGEGVPEGFFKEGWVQWRNDSAFLVRTTY
jgi:hypothetical protein